MAYHHGNLKYELIEEGIALVNEGGIANFSLRKLAKRIGVAPTACYNHFLDKEELLESMTDHINKSLEGALTKAIENAQTSDERYITLAMAKAYVKFFAENSRYFFFMYDAGNYVIQLNDNDLVGEYRPFNMFKEVAIRGMKKRGISNEECKYNLVAMWAMVHGLATLANTKGFRYDGDWEKLTETILVKKSKVYE